MILGIGTDLAEISRIERSIDRFGQRFLERIYTPGEIAYCQRKKASGESFAARFAAKEAAAKALGTGISYGVNWLEFEVRREPSGRPTLHLSGPSSCSCQRIRRCSRPNQSDSYPHAGHGGRYPGGIRASSGGVRLN